MNSVKAQAGMPEVYVKPKRRLSSGKRTLLFMTIPCIIFVALFAYLPLAGWVIAFFDYKPGLNLLNVPFVGLKYLIMAYKDTEMFPVLRNTLVLSFLGILSSPLAVVFAILLNEMRSKKIRKFVQTTTTLPNFISWVLVYALFYIIISSNDGMLNSVLLNLKIIDQPLSPLTNPDIVWPLQTAIGIWKNLGFGSIVYIAAITSIDPELYDAAFVDGAGRFRRIWHITIPGLIPTFITLLLLSIGNLLNTGFEQYYLFNNGLVQEKIQVLDLYVYRIGIYLNNYPMSTAIGISKTLVSGILLIFANWLSKRLRGQSIL